jgi:hypothetical protein
MLKLTRKTGIPDTIRIAAAMRVPGIDPRTWVSYAVVTAVGVDDEGAFADVTTMPTHGQYTARVSSDYAGPGYGFYVPIGVDDEVVVEAPDGDPLNGLVVTGRMHSASDPLPDDAQANPDDLVLVVKPGQSLRISVAGGGKVYVGSSTASDAAVRGTTYRAAEDSYFGTLEGIVAAILTFPALAVYFASPISPAPPTPQFLALQNWLEQIAAFHADPAEYLSTTVEIAE